MDWRGTLTTQQLTTLTSELVAYQDQLAAIHELAHHFSGRLNLLQALQGLVQTAVRALFVRRGAALLSLPERPSLTAASSVGAESEHMLASALAQVQQQQAPVLQNGNGRFPSPGDGDRLLLPLTVRGQVMGVLQLVERCTGPFTTADIKLGQALTAQLEVQVENTLWHEAEVAQAAWRAQLAQAQEVQRCLLPQLVPHISGIDIWAASTPLHEVGGDWYDFIPAQRGAPMVAVGDVCGKGMAAAMLMAMTRTTLRNGDAYLPHSSPARLIQHANTTLHSDYTGVGLFASLFVGHYLPDEGVVRYANAGHAPVIFCPARGDARLLPASNAAIGLLPNEPIMEASLPFGPGDALVVATDGFTEATNARGELLGYERLLEAVSRTAGQNAASIGAVLQAVVANFRGQQPPSDDQTLFVLKGVSSWARD